MVHWENISFLRQLLAVHVLGIPRIKLLYYFRNIKSYYVDRRVYTLKFFWHGEIGKPLSQSNVTRSHMTVVSSSIVAAKVSRDCASKIENMSTKQYRKYAQNKILAQGPHICTLFHHALGPRLWSFKLFKYMCVGWIAQILTKVNLPMGN